MLQAKASSLFHAPQAPNSYFQSSVEFQHLLVQQMVVLLLAAPEQPAHCHYRAKPTSPSEPPTIQETAILGKRQSSQHIGESPPVPVDVGEADRVAHTHTESPSQ
jgi:hypothetical protein